MTHLWREFHRPDPNGPGRAICWCGWTSVPCWLEIRARAEYEAHNRHAMLKADWNQPDWTQDPLR